MLAELRPAQILSWAGLATNRYDLLFCGLLKGLKRVYKAAAPQGENSYDLDNSNARRTLHRP